MTPGAENNDGMLDICMVEHQTRFRLVRLIAAYIRGTQEGMMGVTMDRSEKFHILAMDGGLKVHADGETICINGKELHVSCIPSPLGIIHC